MLVIRKLKADHIWMEKASGSAGRTVFPIHLSLSHGAHAPCTQSQRVRQFEHAIKNRPSMRTLKHKTLLHAYLACHGT